MIVTRYVFPYRITDGRYLLINSLTGAVDLVDRTVIKAFSDIRHGAEPGLPEDAIASLHSRGYLYQSRAEEDALVDRAARLNEQFRADSQALCFVLCPTVSCNLRCPYCFEPHAMHATRNLMSFEQIDLAFAALDAIRARRPDIPKATINLFGGEPLQPFTRPAVARIVERAAARDLPISITSNGSYTDLFLSILAPYRDRIMFDISIDGLKDIHDARRFDAQGQGSFERITDNVSQLLAAGFLVAIRMNLDAANIDTVPQFLEFVREQGWNRHDNFQLNVSPVTNYTGNGGDGILAPADVELRLRESLPRDLVAQVPVALNGDISRLTLPLGDIVGNTMTPGEFMPSIYYCEASGALFYCMGPDGLVYPCNQIIGSAEWAIGHYDPELVIDAGKAALWQGRKVTEMPKCRECSIAFMCAGGCPVMAKRETGSPTDSYCGTSKAELAAYIDAVTPQILQQSSTIRG